MSAEHPQPEYMTPQEVAALFRVDPSTVRRWVRLGKIDSHRTPGGHGRYKTTDVYALFNGETVEKEEEN